MAPKRVLLGIFAHPDDESFGPGATLARYAAEGADVHVVIATDGIAGSVEDPAHVSGHETLAQVRSAELSRAAVALGVTDRLVAALSRQRHARHAGQRSP